ncbi:MAG: PaaI family thioesterase [Hyphomicrobiales bacterium]|nr:PaaI family thioesterase [Hyphomicrobiales bacterium]
MSKEPITYRSDMGLQDTLGYITHVYADRTELHLEVNESHLNRAGLLHGGIFCVLLDSACGYAASRHLSRDASVRVVTLTLTTNYLAPGKKGPVRAIGRVTGGGKTTIFTEGEVLDTAGTILATCSAIMRRVSGCP